MEKGRTQCEWITEESDSCAGEAAVREASAEALTPKAGDVTESGGPGGSQACDHAEPSQGQLKSSRAELSFPAETFPTLWVLATSLYLLIHEVLFASRFPGKSQGVEEMIPSTSQWPEQTPDTPAPHRHIHTQLDPPERSEHPAYPVVSSSHQHSSSGYRQFPVHQGFGYTFQLVQYRPHGFLIGTGQLCPSRLGRCHRTLKQKEKGTLPVRHSSEHPIPFLLPTCSVLPWEGVGTLGEPRSQPLTSARGEEQGSAEQQESSSPRHGAGGRCSLLTWSPFMPVLVLTPGDCVACFLFSGDSARPQCESAWGCTGEAVCVGKMLVLESTEGTG